MHEHLVRRFADAGLQLVLSDRPIVGGVGGRGGRDIVQIDIQRRVNGSRRHEWFRIFPGADDNRIEVVGADKKFGQVVLMVHEVAREFTEDVPWVRRKDYDFTKPDWKETMARNLQVRVSDLIVRFVRDKFVGSIQIRRRTPSQKRHFLLGLDERQLFIAQLPKAVSTVRDAHACLKATTVVLAEGKGIKATRQGEWFFLDPTTDEVARIEDGLARKLLVVEHSVPIGPFSDNAVRGGRRVRQFRGNPHTADELIVLPGIPVQGGQLPVRGREVFIRGRVRHVDHATVSFSGWRKVIRNAEPNSGQALGVGWVD